MGEARKEALRVGFDGQIKLEFRGAAKRVRKVVAATERGRCTMAEHGPAA